jgi:hypothetical protein
MYIMLKSYFVPNEPVAPRSYFHTLGHAAVEFLAALAAVKPSAEAEKLKARRELIQLANSYRESFPSQAKEILELAGRD